MKQINKKIANCIVIGGMIAFGKSTLSKTICQKYHLKCISEINENNNIIDSKQQKRLEDFYKDQTNNSFAIQKFFFNRRLNCYKQKANCITSKMIVFDRSIFEDCIFANLTLTKKSEWKTYHDLYSKTITQIKTTIGVPKLYVILDGDFVLFKTRILQRNRSVEINHFQQNQLYFKKLNDCYTKQLVQICKDYQIDFLIVKAHLTTKQQIKMIGQKMFALNYAFV